VFHHSVEPLMERFVGGDSVVFFAYGMTNAGKTHTIQGEPGAPGVLPQLVEAVLGKLGKMSEWDLQTSMMEIYQEKVYDLLGKKKDKLSIRDGNGRVEVMKLSSHPISSASEAMELMNTAASKRSKSNTFLNTGSSRSHAIYSLTLNRVIDGREVSAVFQVVDLAGAERGKRTMGTMAQQREANNINMSLMQLWRCLQAMQMAHKNGKSTDVIPFRESKLTHLLMPLLSRVGLKGIAMITCVNPQINDYDETLSILGNASLACQIKEISDLGRATTVGIVGHTTATGNPLDNIRAHKRGFKRDSDDLNTRAAAVVKSAASRQRTNSQNSQESTAGNRRSVRVKEEKVVVVATSQEEENEDDEENLADNSALGSELKKLREEVRSLEGFNSELLQSQLARETEIREEVASEMAESSAHLLEQIRELQEQVEDCSSHFKFDVTKSVKKAKKRQLEVADVEHQTDLEEALRDMEVELDTVKENYEGQVDALTEEKERLLSQIEDIKRRAAAAENAVIEREAKIADLRSELQAERERGLKAPPVADDMPDITVKIHEGTQTEPPLVQPEPAPPASADSEGESQSEAIVPFLTQTDDEVEDEVMEVQKDVESRNDAATAPDAPSPSDSAGGTTSHEPTVVDAGSDGTFRDSIRSRTSSMLSSDIIITAPVQNGQRQSAAAEFEQRLKRDQRFKKEVQAEQAAPLAEADKENSQSPVKSPGKAEKGLSKSTSRSPLAPADNLATNTAQSVSAPGGGRTRPVYGKDGTITHVPLRAAPAKVMEDKKAAEASSKGPATRKRLMSPMRPSRSGQQEAGPKVFHTAKSRAREAALKTSPKPIKEEPKLGNHPMTKRLRTRGGL
jgi:hypothetical protein